LAEAVLMAVRGNRKSKAARILMPATVHPEYRAVVDTVCRHQGITAEPLPYCGDAGTVLPDALARWHGGDVTAVVIPQPNFFGRLEDVDALTDWAHVHDAQAIAVVNPLSLALLKPPGEWGGEGADMVCGEGQPLGAPLSSGGPYFGIMACRQKHVRQMPGRIVGRTVDLDGRSGYTLTLQPREQHIRRSKATSNICTNQGLLVTAATIHMSLLGPEGLARTAAACAANTRTLVNKLTAVHGVSEAFPGPGFHEAVLRLPQPPATVLAGLAERGILGGYDLGARYPELSDCVLVCATETKTEDDLDAYANALSEVLERLGSTSAVA
jgi:glycine dehydrogenase subunit 1